MQSSLAAGGGGIAAALFCRSPQVTGFLPRCQVASRKQGYAANPALLSNKYPAQEDARLICQIFKNGSDHLRQRQRG